MKNYLSNILPRLKQYSHDLDRKEVFIEVPWVIIDEQLNQQKYIFRRNGELVMSLNGQVTIGKWEYLSAAKSLMIDRVSDKILLNQNFIDPAVMILNKDGSKNENLILANEILLPDLDVPRYLKKIYYQKNNIGVLGKLMSGEIIEFINSTSGYINNTEVTIEGEPVSDRKAVLAKSGRILEIKNSQVVRILERQSYNTDQGVIIIEKTENSSPRKGDLVFTEKNIRVPDGKYKLGFMKSITVANGRIVS